MELSLLFNRIKKDGTYYSCRKNKHIINVKDAVLKGDSIRKLIQSIKVALTIPLKKLVIQIDSKGIADDAVIQQLEMILAFIFENGVDTVDLSFTNILPSSPYINPLKQSVFGRKDFKDNRCKLFKSHYLQLYYLESYSDTNYFRYYIKREKRNFVINQILSDAITFLSINISDPEYARTLAKAFTEMIDNVRHADSDCVATIKFCDTLIKRENGDPVKAYFINVNDVSNYCIFGKLKEQIASNKLNGATKSIVEKSYPFHSQHFINNGYSLDMFCFISVFQNNLTTSSYTGETGGKGLTYLLRTLTSGSLMYNCYALSGDYVLFFKNEYTHVDNNGNIGFNKSGRYYDDLPCREVFAKSPFYYPGTIFLLEIIIEVDK